MVRVDRYCGALVAIWFIWNIKIIAISKYWPVAYVAIDSISFLSSNQRLLCWWQTAWVDKAE